MVAEAIEQKEFCEKLRGLMRLWYVSASSSHSLSSLPTPTFAVQIFTGQLHEHFEYGEVE